MMRNTLRALGVVCACALLFSARFEARQGQAASETARRRFDSGRDFLRDGRHAEALGDFQAVVQLFPTSDVADDAQLSIAELQLDTYADPAAARATLKQLLDKYPSGTAAPMAFVLLGRVQLVEASTAAAVGDALASFDRVRRLFPESAAVPAAAYYSGEALRGVRRFNEAMLKYQRVFAEYPRSEWAARARLGAARCLVQQGQPQDAMAELQRVRLRFPDTTDAARALAWNTILYRLYVRAPAQPPYAYSGRTLSGTGARLSDVRALAVDRGDTIYVVSENSVRVLAPAGTVAREFGTRDARALFFDREGAPLVLMRGGIMKPGGPSTLLGARRSDGTSRPLESLEAAVALSSGTVLVADRDNTTVYRLDAQLKNQGSFLSGRPSRMAVADQDEIALLDQDAKSVLVVSREAATLYRVAQRGATYALENPVDVAFDALGHLYVLDRERGAVSVFDPSGKYILTFTLPEKTPGAFRRATSLAVDSAGRMYIADDRAGGVLVFQ